MDSETPRHGHDSLVATPFPYSQGAYSKKSPSSRSTIGFLCASGVSQDGGLRWRSWWKRWATQIHGREERRGIGRSPAKCCLVESSSPKIEDGGVTSSQTVSHWRLASCQDMLQRRVGTVWSGA